MESARQPRLTRRDLTLLTLLAAAPVTVFAVARLAGLMKFLKLGVAAAVGAAVGIAMLTRPKLGVLFVVFWVYAGLGFYLPGVVPLGTMLVVFAAVLLEFMRGRPNLLVDGGYWWSLGLFVLIAVGSMLVAVSPMNSIAHLFQLAKCALVVFLVVQLIRTAEDARLLAYTVFAGALATVFLGLIAMRLGLLNDPMTIGWYGPIRFSGLHENPNRAAAYMCSALPLGIFCIRHAGTKLLRVASGVGAAVLIGAIFSTFSRSVVFPFGLLAVAVIVREVRNRRAYIALLVLLVAGMLLTPGHYWQRIMALTEVTENITQDHSVMLRYQALVTALDLFAQNPITGIGLNNFIVRAAYNLDARIVVHNTYLETAVGTGIFGLIAFLGILYSGWSRSVAGARHRWVRSPEWMRSLAFYFALSLTCAAISAMFGTMPFIYILWVPVAAGLVVGNLLRRETS